MTTPERVASGVYRVDAIGIPNAISVLLLEDRDGFALVDTGLGSSADSIREALAGLGGRPEDLKRICITHHHPDHIGGLPGVLEWAPDAELVAPTHEAEIISGESEPDAASSPLLRFFSRFQKLPTVPVDRVAHEGDMVAGFRVVPTPGHTPSGTPRSCGTRTVSCSPAMRSEPCFVRSRSEARRLPARIPLRQSVRPRGYSRKISIPWS